MNKFQYFILSMIFMIMSGILFTIERCVAYYIYIEDVKLGYNRGYPSLPSIFDNLFVPILLIFGISFLIIGSKRPNP